MPTLLQFLSLSSPPFGSNGTGISVVNIYLQADCSSWNNQWIGVGANIVGATLLKIGCLTTPYMGCLNKPTPKKVLTRNP